MPTFHYKAVTPPGEIAEGIIEADSQAAVIDQLRSQGYLPIRAEPSTGGAWTDVFSPRRWRRSRVSAADATLVVRELATLLRAGLALDQALDVLVTYAPKASVREVLARVMKQVKGGSSLAEAMAGQRGVFDRFTIGMVRAGEAGGSLDTVLARTAEYLERVQQTKQNLKSALVYPIILMVTAFASVAVIVTVVIPSFKEIFDQAGFDLPLSTRIVMFVGTMAQSFWWVPPLALAGAILYLSQLRRTEDGRRAMDLKLLSIPLTGDLLRKIEVGRFSYTLGMLLTNGVPLLAALPVARDTIGNAAIAHSLDEVAKQVKEGRSLAAPLEAGGLFPSLAIRLLRIGEESGRLEDMLFKIADTYEQEVQRGIQRGLTLLVPVLTVVIALVIAGIIISVLVPMLSINELVF